MLTSLAKHPLFLPPHPAEFRLRCRSASTSVAGVVINYAGRQEIPQAQKRLAILFATTFLAYLSFCSLNFFTLRYLLTLIVPLTMWLVYLVVQALRAFSLPALVVAPLVVAASGYTMFRHDSGLGDMNMGSFKAMEVQEATVRFLEQRGWFEKEIGIGSFQDAEHLRKPYTGFLHTPRAFEKVRGEIDALTEVVVFNNIEPDGRREEVAQDHRYQRVFRVVRGAAWAEVYERKGLQK